LITEPELALVKLYR